MQQASFVTLEERVRTGKALVALGRLPEAVAILDETLQRAEYENDDGVRSDALESLFWCAQIRIDGALKEACARRMLEPAISNDSPRALRLHVRHAVAMLQLGHPGQALAIIERAERVSREADIETFALYLGVKADVLGALGRDDDALGCARLAADISSKRSDPTGHWYSLAFLGYSLESSGRFAESIETYGVATAIGKAAGLTWEPGYTSGRAAWTAFQSGDIAGARRLLDDARRSTPIQPWVDVQNAWIALQVGLAVGDEELIAAGSDRAHLQAALASADAYSLQPVIAAFHDFERRRGANQSADELLALGAEQLTSPEIHWMMLARIARYGTEAMIVKTKALLERFPRHHRVARANAHLFHALLAFRAGDRASGERGVGEAQLLFEDFGGVVAATECMELSGRVAEATQRYRELGLHGEVARLRRVPVRRGRPRRGYHASVQRREIRRLLVQGETIACIGDRLGLSAGTVKARVADIYDAEGVATRAEFLKRVRSGR